MSIELSFKLKVYNEITALLGKYKHMYKYRFFTLLVNNLKLQLTFLLELAS